MEILGGFFRLETYELDMEGCLAMYQLEQAGTTIPDTRESVNQGMEVQ